MKLPLPHDESLVDAAIEAFATSLPPALRRAPMLHDLQEAEIRDQIAAVLPVFLSLSGDRSISMRHAVEFAVRVLVTRSPPNGLSHAWKIERRRRYASLAKATRAFMATVDAITWMEVLELTNLPARHHWLLELRAKGHHARRKDLEALASGAERAAKQREKRGPRADSRRMWLMESAARGWHDARGRPPGRSRDAIAGGPLRGPFVRFVKELFAAAKLDAPSDREIIAAVRNSRMDKIQPART